MNETERLGALVTSALDAAGLPARTPAFERPRQRAHGDWSTNVALTLAKPVGRPPREIAASIVAHLPAAPDLIGEVTVAGPGFINVRLAHGVLQATIRDVVAAGASWGRAAERTGRRVNVEFVSANPTGPLHIGHGRWVVVGDALAALIDAAGDDVVREYYFNDAGNQMTLFAASVEAALAGEPPPDGGYGGAYIAELAEELRAAHADDVASAAYHAILERIDATLRRFGVVFDVYFGEKTLHDAGRVDEAITRLRENGHVFEQDGATWLRTTTFGDDKDRVLLRANGQPTYFAADCAYLLDKIGRGFDRCLYVLGADHHGYVRRLEALERALGFDGSHVEVLIGQLVNFLREGEPVRMSKRTGTLVTLDELADEVGVDAVRYALLRQTIDTTIDVDLADVVRTERDNPVYYVQYSHARISGILRTGAARGVHIGDVSDAPLHRLVHPTEEALVQTIATFPGVVTVAAADRAPHKVARYAEGLAEHFHRFYTECTVLSDDAELTTARWWLVEATRRTLVNALGLLGVSAPERM